MKKVSTILSLLFVLQGVAQNYPIDFEPGGFGATWNWAVFENDINPPLNQISNPDPTGVNTTATVAEFTALVTGMPFAGTECAHGEFGLFTLSASNSEVRIHVWKPVISNVGIKLVTTSGGALPEILVPNTTVNQWEELVFDFSAYVNNAIYAAEDVDQIVIFPDFNARTQTNICYFDNITIGAGTPTAAPAVAAPTPTIPQPQVISMFSDAYTDVPVDTWQTPWSSGTLTDLQIAGNPTKRYTALDFVGVETVANQIDISDMDTFHVDMWTPNMTEFRVKLVDFGADGAFQGGDDTEHEVVISNPSQNVWNSLSIPMVDFVALTGRNNFAQLVFSGNPAGGGTVYIDNVYFSKEGDIGIATQSQLQVALFPNPASEQVQVNSSSIVDALRLFDLTGKQVLALQPLSNSVNLDVSDLESGVYVLETQQGAVSQTRRLVIR